MINEFLDFLNSATCAFTAVETIKNKLSANGFKELKLSEEWSFGTGGRYYVNVFGSSIVAFSIGKRFGYYNRLNIAAAHTDSPGFVVKPNPEMTSGKYLKLNVESYGGAILNSWLDRPLGLAGIVVCKGKDAFSPVTHVFDSKKPVLVIPNLAIHYNREVNKGVELNKQKDMMPLAGVLADNLSKDDFLCKYIAKELGVLQEEILDFQLHIYNYEAGQVIGAMDDLVMAPRIDNLASAFVCMNQLILSENEKNFNVAAIFDNEEVGSRTKQGAASDVLYRILQKAFVALGRGEDNLNERINSGFLLSLDGAHAIHPNQNDKYDPTNPIYLNDGVVIKKSANQAYVTDGVSAAVIKSLCEANDISYREFVNKSDIAGGSTLGAIASTKLPMRMADVGIPMLAMHSAMELMGKEDLKALDKLVKALFES